VEWIVIIKNKMLSDSYVEMY